MEETSRLSVLCGNRDISMAIFPLLWNTGIGSEPMIILRTLFPELSKYGMKIVELR